MVTSNNALLFYFSYYESILELKPMQQLEAYDSIFRYAFLGVEPNPSKAFRPLWKLIKPNIDSSIKKRVDGSKGGRKPETTGSYNNKTTGFKTEETNGPEAVKTTGNPTTSSNKEKEKEKERDIDKGKGIGAKAPSRRSLKRPPAAVFESMPEKPPDGDAETQRLKQEFSQKWNRVCKEHDNATAEPSTETAIPDSSTQAQAPQTSGIQATDHTDLPEHENRAPHEPRSPPG